jgi:hypothetical protein
MNPFIYLYLEKNNVLYVYKLHNKQVPTWFIKKYHDEENIIIKREMRVKLYQLCY